MNKVTVHESEKDNRELGDTYMSEDGSIYMLCRVGYSDEGQDIYCLFCLEDGRYWSEPDTDLDVLFGDEAWKPITKPITIERVD